MTRYVVITPVRDEATHIVATIESLRRQTLRPQQLVFVNDGSADETGPILDRCAAQIPWITAVHRPDRGYREAGGGVVETFYEGYRALKSDTWEFVVKLDGDLTFAREYFERCFQHFEEELRLGIGGGDIYHSSDGSMKLERTPRFHVRGATKIYRRACWEDIGGLVQAPGWDTVDEVKANMLGWSTRSFSELHLLHHRITGAAQGLLPDRVKCGVACYVSGYHPLFVLASCLRRVIRKPYVVGSLALAWGFIKGYLRHLPRVEDSQFIRYIRSQQLRRLCGLETIWK